MEALPKCNLPMMKCHQKCAGDVLRMHMMDSLHSKIWDPNFFTVHECGENSRIEVSLRVDGRPSRAHEMARVKNRDRESGVFPLLDQIALNRGLPNTIVAKRTTRPVFSGGNDGAVSMHPDRPAMQEMAYTAAERLHQLLGALQAIACKVDHGLGHSLGDAFSKCAVLLFRDPVEMDIGN